MSAIKRISGWKVNCTLKVQDLGWWGLCISKSRSLYECISAKLPVGKPHYKLFGQSNCGLVSLWCELVSQKIHSLMWELDSLKLLWSCIVSLGPLLSFISLLTYWFPIVSRSFNLKKIQSFFFTWEIWLFFLSGQCSVLKFGILL